MSSAPPDRWLWIQHRDLAEPAEAGELRDCLARTAFTERGHGGTFSGGRNVYVLSVGPDIDFDSAAWWFHARPQEVDGQVRFQVSTGGRTRPTTSEHSPVDAAEVRNAFSSFLDSLVDSREAGAESDSLAPDQVHRWLQAFDAALPELRERNRERVAEVDRIIIERFGAALDGLEDLVLIAERVLQEGWVWLYEHAWTSKSAALVNIMRRVCSTTREILDLLRSGHSVGAVARWRTLNELRCTAMLLQQTPGDDIADRYIAQGAIAEWQFQLKVQEDENLVGKRTLSEAEASQLKTDHDAAFARYGKDVDKWNSWWWAGVGLDTGVRRSFNQVQKKVGVLIPAAMQQGHAEVHGGHGSAIRNADPRTAIWPPVPDGATAPGHNAVVELKNALRAFCVHWANVDPTMEREVLPAFWVRAEQVHNLFDVKGDLEKESRLGI